MISGTYAPEHYVGTGEQTVFPITFSFQLATDIVVKLRHTTGEETDWTQPTHYSVVGTDVVAVTAPSSDYVIWIFRDTPQTQLSDFQDDTIERMGDKLTRLTQELAERLSRSVLFKPTTTEADHELPEPEDDYFLRWAAGKLVNSKAFGGASYSIQSFMVEFLEALTKAAARMTLDVYSQAAHDADIDDLAGAGRTTETVKGNADDIATKVPTTRQVIAGTGLSGGGDLSADRTLTLAIPNYETGWINRSDWTNVHLGTDDTKNADSNVTHNLGANLSDLLVKVMVSTDGADANSFESIHSLTLIGAGSYYGIAIYQVDTNNIKVQTGALGFVYINDAGAAITIDTEDWYYKIKVWKLG